MSWKYKVASWLFGRTTIGVFSFVEVEDVKGRRYKLKAKVDTGAFRTSIDRGLAEKLGLIEDANLVKRKLVGNAHGKSVRNVYGVTIYLGGKKLMTNANVQDRTNMRHPILIGRRDLRQYVIMLSGNDFEPEGYWKNGS